MLPSFAETFRARTGGHRQEIAERYFEFSEGDINTAVLLYQQMWDQAPTVATRAVTPPRTKDL